MAFEDRSRTPTELILEGTLPAPPAEVFAWLVEPERLARWWPPVAEVDLRPGGSYHFAWPAMGWDLRGVYRAVAPGVRLAFTWRWDHEPEVPERTVAIELAAVEEGARVTVRHGTYAGDGGDTEERNGHRDGWQHFLGVLEGRLGDAR